MSDFNTYWTLTSTEIPTNENIGPLDMPGDIDGATINIGHSDYHLTKTEKPKSMKGVPFSDEIKFVAFLKGDEQGERFADDEDWVVIADVELVDFEGGVTLYFANGEEEYSHADFLAFTKMPRSFKKEYIDN